ncbi:MAG: caspase family protein, partial [Fischerella sp.]|nr:caspase family protein [Fischerella sp.]
MVKNWALAIGINHYEFLQPLKYAERDAQLIQQFFRHEAGFERVLLFSDRSPDLAGTSTRPNRANLWQFLQQFFERPLLKPEDNFWFFFSGHGMVHNGHDYLMPCDANPEDIENTAISVRDLIERLHRCGSDNIILIFDACRYQNKKTGEGIGRQTQQIACKTGAIGIFACGPDEHSHEIDTLQKGVFTHALLEGLGNQGQCATIERLNQYLSFRVPQLVSQYKNTRQTPHIVAEPKTKLRLILLPKHATLDDIATLKISAFQAEDDRDLAAAEQLWMQVHAAVSIPDMDFIEAIQRIAQLRAEFPQSCTNLALQSASVRRNGGFCWPLPTTEVTNSNLCLEEISKIPENFLKVSDTTILPHYTYKIKDNYANLYSEQE